MNHIRWLNELKEGDTVQYFKGGAMNIHVKSIIATVKRITDRQIVVDIEGKEKRFTRSWGIEFGYNNSSFPPKIQEYIKNTGSEVN